jgi:hypothetical protein
MPTTTNPLLRAIDRVTASIARTATNRTSAAPGRQKKSKRPFRPNPWRKCTVCFHRVPELCGYCLGGERLIVPTHVDACCPGKCVRCVRCRLECPGPCPRQQHCADRCPGACETGEHCVDNCPGHEQEETP